MSQDPDDIEQWKRDVWNAMSADERNRILEDQREHKRRERRKKYDDYMNSDQWRLLRRLKLEEANGACEVCNKQSQLEIHHRTYDRLFCERLNDLMVLCNVCHELYESNKRLKKYSA